MAKIRGQRDDTFFCESSLFSKERGGLARRVCAHLARDAKMIAAFEDPLADPFAQLARQFPEAGARSRASRHSFGDSVQLGGEKKYVYSEKKPRTARCRLTSPSLPSR